MSLGRRGGIRQGNHCGRLVCNLGAAAFDAKGTAQDYLAHLEPHCGLNNGGETAVFCGG
jgi:hypothetical protein